MFMRFSWNIIITTTITTTTAMTMATVIITESVHKIVRATIKWYLIFAKLHLNGDYH